MHCQSEVRSMEILQISPKVAGTQGHDQFSIAFPSTFTGGWNTSVVAGSQTGAQWDAGAQSQACFFTMSVPCFVHNSSYPAPQSEAPADSEILFF